MSKNKSEKNLNLVPTSGYLIVEPAVVEEKTAGGIYLPDNVSGDKPQQGTVLAVGPDEITDNGVKKSSPAKIGQKIVYKKWGGNEVKVDGKEYLFVKFEDVLAVIAN
ncbi:MAG: co-chaperone GroES [Patescibacteria group bacterium]|nr:co-chaperone GroES [Patescibacteria group bacterium]